MSFVSLLSGSRLVFCLVNLVTVGGVHRSFCLFSPVHSLSCVDVCEV